jgi:hypothetical protein
MPIFAAGSSYAPKDVNLAVILTLSAQFVPMLERF